MFGWIPIIGPIIDGIVRIFSKWQDTVLGKYTVDGKVDVVAMAASEGIIAATRDDIGVRLARDLMIFPVCVWTTLISWDTIVAIRYPGYMFHVAPYPPALEYLPYAVVTFLLGAVGITTWKRLR
jgi:hypothetical protein